MNYIQIIFKPLQNSSQDLLEALLHQQENVTGLEIQEENVLAYAASDEFVQDTFKEIASQCSYSVSFTELPQKNWNEVWESNFEPITLEGFCHVRADFHPPNPYHTPYEIVITPKMSFGTGHHATTQMMMGLMKSHSFTNKKILDFGTGTGILAILASMLGASEIKAIDNDSWCIENSIENCERNNIKNVEVSIEDITHINHSQYYDTILANINRQILIDYFPRMKSLLAEGGTIFLSGILEEDIAIICAVAQENGLSPVQEKRLNKWVAMEFGMCVDIDTAI